MLLIHYPAGRDPEWRYILRVVCTEYLGIPFEACGQEREDVEIRLAQDPGHRTLRIASNLLSIDDESWMAPPSLPELPLSWTTPAAETPLLHDFTDRLPVLYSDNVNDKGYFHINTDDIGIGVDIFGTAFFMLTRYEELLITDRDPYQRFPSSATLAVRERFQRIPVVQAYLEILWTLMVSHWPGLTRSSRTYRVILTHDVDSPTSRSWPTMSVMKHVVGDLTLRHDPKLAFRRSLSLLYDRWTGKSPEWDVLNTFPYLMDSAEQFGLTTTFNLLPCRTSIYNDASYSVSDPPLRTLLRMIRARGHAIGYHASFGAHEEHGILRREIAELQRVCAEEGIHQTRWGGRHHFLKWKNPETWQSWNDAGLAYDSSLGYSDDVGFRCGCCFEYPAFNLTTRTMLALREHPLIYMDVALTENRGMSMATVVQAMESVSRACRKYHGDLVILWHNTSVVGSRERRLYLDILSAIV